MSSREEPSPPPRGAASPSGGEKPLIAIVGRPNVGKSSLFNAILGRRSAIVAEEAGTTRDRMIAEAEFEGHRFLLADTGGLVPEPETEMEAHITAQVDAALDAADAVLFVTDARTSPGYADEAAARPANPSCSRSTRPTTPTRRRWPPTPTRSASASPSP